jgi:predicted lipoprotein with Yx(FWY)xxD motif
MNTQLYRGLMAVALSAAALAGCSSGSNSATPAASSSAPSAAAPSSSSSTTSSSAETSDLSVASTSVGKVIVDAKHLTAYIFTKDTANSGKSVCTGECLTAWPPILSRSAQPTVSGVTGKVGTITLAGGKRQVTVNGLPLYTFFKDTKPGDVVGQGVGKVWYVLAPNGKEIRSVGASSGY